MNRYYVEQNFRGFKTIAVLANSAAEALAKIHDCTGRQGIDLEGIDWQVTSASRARHVRLSERNVPQGEKP